MEKVLTNERLKILHVYEYGWYLRLKSLCKWLLKGAVSGVFCSRFVKTLPKLWLMPHSQNAPGTPRGGHQVNFRKECKPVLSFLMKQVQKLKTFVERFEVVIHFHPGRL